MSLDRTQTERITLLLEDAIRDISQVHQVALETLEGKELEKYTSACTKVVRTLSTELLEGIYKNYPELEPEWLKGSVPKRI